MKNYKCEKCDILFSRKNNLNRHLKKKHPSNEGQTIRAATTSSSSRKACPFCDLFFQNNNQLVEHIWSPQHRSLLPFTSRSSISRKVVIYQMSLEENNTSLAKFCSSNHTVNMINNLVKSQIAVRTVFRMSIALFADYEIPNLDEEETGGKSVDNDTFTLRSKGLLLNRHQSERQRRSRIRSMLRGAARREEDLLTRGSGWRFQNLRCCDILLYDSSNVL